MIALFIGRFQPFHKAHLHDVQLARKECKKVVIAIGSSQESGTPENPFSYMERKDMITAALKANHISAYTIVPVPDIHDDQNWVEHVRSIVPHFDIVYTGNDFTDKLFAEKGIQVRKIELIPNINATEIRERIIKDKDWRYLVPKEIAEEIIKLNGVEKIKDMH
ncbi:MAG TPA: nicotinamide-nucleotide adenylyltransferase [Candidatus Nanoarchaeia archaeon]|nr:nicotinamide-nucleotide adenylyltransferase [Candidatus Nanoarchaeia archaeon]